ncbi:MAG TPA: putative LPS assembly protein LptD [Rhodothermales bacterium]|nr:putative LPS assembly protein LptD [Rhodothermales bacterium]
MKTRVPGANNTSQPPPVRGAQRKATVSAACLFFVIALAAPSLAQSGESSGTTADQTVRFAAKDSLVLVIGDSSRIGRLFGSATMTNADVNLSAYRIDIDFDTEQLSAVGLATDTGLVGKPQFEKGEEKFFGSRLTYNLESGRGRVEGARTTLDEGFIYGGVSKQGADSVLYVKDAMFTTCDHEEAPHYHIRTGRMKIVNGKWIYTGPLHLRILNIPLPVWLPFGFLPATEGRRSGPLPPTYGEDSRGFFLRDFGWYWAINNYMDVQTRLGIWTNGSFQIAPQFRYNKRYGYSGQASLDWVRSFSGLENDPDFQQADTWSLRANHTQTIGTTASLNAKIDYATSNYLRTVARGYDDQVRQTIGSDLQFNKRWKGRTLTLYASQRQVLTTGEVQMTLPQLSFSQQTIRPFASTGASRSPGPLENLTVSYRGGITNRYRFVRDTLLAGSAEIDWFDALFSQDKYRQATGDDERFDFQATHSVPIAANFSVNRIPGLNRQMRLNFAPSFQYNEDWYLRTERRRFDPDSGRVILSSESEFAAIRQFSTSVNANTEFYGTFPWRIGPFRTFRHVVRPSAAMTFRPDFSSDVWGYYRSYIAADGTEVRYPIVRGVSAGDQQTLSFRLANVFQAKRAVPDSLAEQGGRSAAPSQLLSLDLGSAFNFAADSLKWAPLSVSARTRVLDRFDFNLNASMSPYAIDSLGRTIDRYTDNLFRLTNLSFTARTSVSGGRGARPRRPYSGMGSAYGSGGLYSATNATGEALSTFGSDYRNTSVGYADFSNPWSIAADFTYNINKSGFNTNRRAIVNTGIDFNLTSMWKVQARTGYDLGEGEIVTTNITILRDFHDWEMGFNWTPFGDFASYQFDLHLKTGPLKDLLRLRVPQQDDRFRQVLN